jgi:integrase/DNA-directed RNA polymerase subunit RPC12/RpoP
MVNAVVKGSSGSWVMAASPEECILGEKSGLQTGGPEPLQQPPIKCPECNSLRIWKDGLRYVKSETGTIAVQRYICRSCGRRFSETDPVPTKPRKRKSSPKREKNADPFGSYLKLNTSDYKVNGLTSTCQVCVSEAQGAKNLVKVKTRQEKAQREGTKKSKSEIKGKLLEYSWYLKKQGYANCVNGREGTIQKRTRLLKRLIKLEANLWDPESVKKTIAMQEKWSDGYKVNAVYAYQSFLNMEGLTWIPPRYKQPKTLPFVPLESEIDLMINASGKKVSIFLQGIKETGTDPGELLRAEWSDINEEAKTIDIKHPVKGHDPRILPISRKAIARFHMLPKTSTRIFPMPIKSMNANFWWQRKRIAKSFDNPRLLKLTFTSIRHWKATTEYHKTRDILHVKRLLGHKCLSSTMKYIDIERAIYGKNENDSFISRVATSLKGARSLIEAGFEYVTDMDSYKIFRKRN